MSWLSAQEGAGAMMKRAAIYARVSTTNIWNSAFPPGVVVSIPWRSRYKSTPAACRSPRKATRSCRDRPSLSHGPSHHHVDLAPRSGLAEPIKGWALVASLGPRDTAVHEFLDNFPTCLFGNLSKATDLVRWRLPVGGRDASINRCTLHHGSSSLLC